MPSTRSGRSTTRLTTLVHNTRVLSSPLTATTADHVDDDCGNVVTPSEYEETTATQLVEELPSKSVNNEEFVIRRRSAKAAVSSTTKRARRRLDTNKDGSELSPQPNAAFHETCSEQVQDDKTIAAKSSTPKRKTTKRVRILPGSLPPPPNYSSIYTLVQELRSDRTAPVDSNGSESLPERQYGPQTYRFQVLISLMLSSQTKDAIVGQTMKALQSHGLTLDKIHFHTSQERLDELIGRVGFHTTKAKHIKQVAAILHRDYGGDIPCTALEMIQTLPGVGPKMAYIVENVAWNRVSGIGIDTHMHRIFNQLRWVNSNTPEQTREQLEGWLPKEEWQQVNVLWVGFGQEVQQQKKKMLVKALNCSRPREALELVMTLGLNWKRDGTKFGLDQEIQAVTDY